MVIRSSSDAFHAVCPGLLRKRRYESLNLISLLILAAKVSEFMSLPSWLK